MAATTDISRRSFIKGTAVLAAMIPLSSILAACSSDEQSSGSNAQSESSILVAYYSAQGHTELWQTNLTLIRLLSPLHSPTHVKILTTTTTIAASAPNTLTKTGT